MTRNVGLLFLVPAWCLTAPAQPCIPTKPFVPEPILSGGVVLSLYPADSPRLKKDRIQEAERYNTTLKDKSGPTKSVLNIHNPSIEVHLVGDTPENTGAAVIVAPGGGHQILWVGPEGGDFVPFFKKHGVSTIVLRNRLPGEHRPRALRPRRPVWRIAAWSEKSESQRKRLDFS